MTRFDVPVVVIAFNRPTLLARILERVASIRPEQVLVVTDGPRTGTLGDDDRCRAVARLIEQFGEQHPLRWERSDRNLGCSGRVTSGLDWAFEQVDRAIVLEDDMLPDPMFFPWARQMLACYADDPGITTVSGGNILARWPDAVGDHLVASRGNVWGWATWSEAWASVRSVDPIGAALRDPERAYAALHEQDLDPLVLEHLHLHLAAAIDARLDGRALSWDIAWGLGQALGGTRAVVSRSNLVRHLGIGPDATHHHEEDFTARLPIITRHFESGPGSKTHNARRLETAVPGLPRDFDRAALLVQLLSRCRNPHAALRLARSRRLPLEPEMRHHLRPFEVPDESLAVMRHLRRLGLDAPDARLLEHALVGAGTDGWRCQP